jgi:hypothetical protein
MISFNSREISSKVILFGCLFQEIDKVDNVIKFIDVSPAKTGKDNKSNTAVTKIAHTNKGNFTHFYYTLIQRTLKWARGKSDKDFFYNMWKL